MPKKETVLHYQARPKAGGAGTVGASVTLGGRTHNPVTLESEVDDIFSIADQVLSLDSQAANLVLASPDGAAGLPVFRAITLDDFSGTWGTPAFTFGTAAAEGSAATWVRSDATIALFDTTNPTTIAPDDSATPGSAGVAARRDHGHALPAAAPASPSVSLAASTEGTGSSVARSDHAHQLDEDIEPTWTGPHLWDQANPIQLRSSAQQIYSSTANTLDIEAGSVLAIDAPTVTLDGDLQFVGPQEIDTSSGDLTIAAAGNVLFNPTGDNVRPAAAYDLNLGTLDYKWLTVHAAELWVSTLVAQQTIATIGGTIVVAPSTELIADCGVSDTTIDVKHNSVISGDRLWLMAAGKLEYMAVTSGATGISGGYRYSVTRNLDGTGSNQWYAGDAVVNTGQTGAGFIELYSLWGVTAPPLGYIFNYNATGAAFSSNYADAANWSPFDDGANSEVNDAVYFGVENTAWEGLSFYLTTAAAYTATLVWEYWSGSGWVTFSPTATDFKSTGTQTVLWDQADLTGWASNSVNSVTAYWVRVRISAFTSWTTLPDQETRQVRRGASQYGPTITGWVRQSATYNDLEPRWAIGNLNGLYGITENYYGVGIGDPDGDHLLYDTSGGLRIVSVNQNFNISDAGVVLTLDDTGGGLTSITMKNAGGSILGRLTGIYEVEGTGHEISLSTFSLTGYDSDLNLEAYAPSGEVSTVHLMASASGYTELDVVSTGYVMVNPDLRVQGGLYVGNNYTDPDADDIHFDGNLKSVKSSGSHDVYGFVPLADPLTHTSFDGDSFSDVGTNTKIENTGWSTTIPAEAVALEVEIRIRDSGSSGANGLYFALFPYAAATTAGLISVLNSVPDDEYVYARGKISCDAGDLWYQVNASGSGTMDVWLKVWGYFI